MPSVSKSQQRLMAAAEHGAEFPAARKVRESMTPAQMHDYAAGPMQGKPEHVQKAAPKPSVPSPASHNWLPTGFRARGKRR